MFYVEVHAPMDCVFVGPFATMAAAVQHAADIVTNTGHDAYPMTEAQMQDSVTDYGALPLQSPEAFDAAENF